MTELAAAFFRGEAPARILPGNRNLWDVAMITARQWRTEVEGVIGPKGGYIGARLAGIDLPVAIRTAEAMEITVDRAFLTRVRTFESEVLKQVIGKRDAPREGPCTSAQEEECRILYGEYFEATCRMCRKEEENG